MRLIPRNPNYGYLDTHLWIPKQFINVEGTKQALSFAFPDAKTERKVRYVYLWKDAPYHLLVPRHFWSLTGLPFPVIDCRPPPAELQHPMGNRIKLDHTVINGELQATGKTTQREAHQALERNPSGLLQIACGGGKSVVALDHIARRKGPALILVDNTQLLEHWRDEISAMLDVPGGIGLVKADSFDWQKDIVLATYQTIAHLADNAPEEFRRHFATIVWDEGHHISAPTFASGAELFYGYRLALSATPKRDDGCEVIYNLHVGPVIYKNLKQDLKARTIFTWTGLEPDETRPDCQIRDKTGEMHLSMLGVYCGRWREHLNHVLGLTWGFAQEGRHVLVLCSSVDEAVNLCAIWNGLTSLYTDIPVPTKEDVGETVFPAELDETQLEKLPVEASRLETKLAKHTITPDQRLFAEERLAAIQLMLRQHKVHKKVQALLRKRQREYLKDLERQITTGGLMIYKVDPKVRQAHLKNKQVVFCFKKYGREGLNDKALDTVITTLPFSSRNTLQQVRGRVERLHGGKKEPLLIIVEHNIGPAIGMCQKLRGFLRDWPADEGGPFTFDMHNHPYVKSWNNKKLFG